MNNVQALLALLDVLDEPDPDQIDLEIKERELTGQVRQG